MKYSQSIIDSITLLRSSGMTWKRVAEELSKSTGEKVSPQTVRGSYKYHHLKLELGTQEVDLASLGRERSARKASTLATKRLRVALDELEDMSEFTDVIMEGFEDIVEQLKEASENISQIVTYEHSENTPMTLELMISDLHFGKKTSEFNEAVGRDRMRQVTKTVIKEIALHKSKFSVDKIVIFLGGDIIESASMHGEESRAGCEYGNARQVVTAIDILSKELIIPLAIQGIPLDIIGIAGNHDRSTKSKTYVDRGEEFYTFIIYNGLKNITESLGLDVNYKIPKETYCIYDIYQSSILYEHGDEVKGNSKAAFETHIAKRQKQFSRLLDGLRIGHWHEYSVLDRGRIIVNGSLCGGDGYADTHGYATEAMQVLNFYCPSDRPTSFYKSFPIYLK